MTVTVRKCDFCGQEISPKIRSCKTVIITKSHESCIEPLQDDTFDICHDCISKRLDCLYGHTRTKDGKMTTEDLDRIKRAEEMCNALEKENKVLKMQLFSLKNERNTFLAQNEQYEKDLIELTEANEWHSIKDGYLPKQRENTCFSIEVLANNMEKVYYCFGSGKWFHKNKEVKILAWHELPKFEVK